MTPRNTPPDEGAPLTPPTPDSAPDPASNANADVESRDDPAWSLYHEAFATAAAGQWAEARRLLLALQNEHPEHPAGEQAKRLLAAMDRADRGSTPTPTPTPTPTTTTATDSLLWPEKPATTARAELALLQTLHGIAVGIELCVALDCNDSAPFIALPLLGGGLGLGASLGFISDVTPGHRAVLNSGTLWGAYNGALLSAITDMDASSGAATLLGMQLGGILAGETLWRNVHVTEGQMAAANTVGIWSGVATALLIETAGADIGDDDKLGYLLLVSDLGLIAGSVLGQHYPRVSRGRTLVIDAGGIVGALTGSGVAVLIGGDNTDTQTATGSALVGVVLGLAASTYLTRTWDAPGSPSDKLAGARLMMMPNADGGMSAGLRWDLSL